MIKYFEIFFLIIFVTILSGQSADEVILKIQNKFSVTEDIKANFTQKINSANQDNTLKLTGTFYFKKENRLRIEIKNRLIVSDGNTIWNLNQNENKLIISSYDSDYTSFSLPQIINNYPNLCDKELIVNTPNKKTVRLVPNDNQLNFQSAEISVNTNSLIEKVIITDFNSMKFIFELTKTQTNIGLSDNLFVYEPEEGVEIVDLR